MKKILILLAAILGLISAATSNAGMIVAPGVVVVTAVSGALGGSVLLAGACSNTTVSVPSATVGMVAIANPTTYPGDGSVWRAYVSAAGTVTLKVCAIVGLTPTSTTYNIRVVQ